MPEAVIASAVRTPVGRAPKGMLRAFRPDDLGAIAIKEAIARVPGLDPGEVEDVILGCAMPEAEQGMNVARSEAMRATFIPCSASGMAQPRMTSSTSFGSRPGARARASLMAVAARSSGRTPRNAPL